MSRLPRRVSASRRRRNRTLALEALEVRQLLHGGIAPRFEAQALNLRIVGGG